jgi:TonB family protein
MHPTLRTLLVFAGLIAPVLALGQLPQPEQKDNEPLTVIRTAAVFFPPALASEHINQGEVSVVIWVDDTGRLLDWLLVGYTHPLFAKEVLDVLPRWKFIPSYVQGQPTFTRTELRFLFKNTETIRVVTGDTGLSEQLKEATANGRRLAARIYRPDELDQPLDAVVEISPRPPDRLGASARAGSVVVDYLVDAEGKVRMPIIASSDDEAFTNSVLLAITEWRYAVPKHVGRPVITVVRQKFTFTPTS